MRWIIRLLGLLTGPSLAASIEGDLMEERHRRAARSPAAATVWMWRELLAVCLHAGAARLRTLLVEGRPLRLVPGRSEFRHAFRALRSNPFYLATAAGVVALSMTLATTVFAVVQGVLFRPLPYERPDDLYRLFAAYSDEALAGPGVRLGKGSRLALSVPDIRDFEAAVPEARFALYSTPAGQRRLGTLQPWEPITARISQDLLHVLGVQPLLGGFGSDDYEEVPDAPTPALVSHHMWQTQFGGRLDVIGHGYAPGEGSTVRYRIAGVLPEDFVYPARGVAPDLLTPLIVPPAARIDRRARQYDALVRLPSTVPLRAYTARLDAVARSIASEMGPSGENGGAGPADAVALEPLGPWLGGTPRAMSRQVLGLALLLVLLGCLNVSTLVATRGLERGRELSLRRAIGARTSDVIALVLAETSLLVLLGTALGVMFAVPMLSLVLWLMPQATVPSGVPAIELRVLAFAAVGSILSIAIVSIWPAARSLRLAMAPVLAEGGPTVAVRRSFARSLAVSLQVALGLVVVVCGAFVVGSLVRAAQNDLGFSSEHVILLEGRIPEVADAGPEPRPPADQQARTHAVRHARTIAVDELLGSIRARPGVLAAGATQAVILRQGAPGGAFFGDTYAITAGFVDAVQPRLVSGRWPTAAELEAGADVAVITTDAARHYFGSDAAIGKVISQGPYAVEVVGITRPARYPSWDWSNNRRLQFYIPYRSSAALAGTNVSVLVRTRGPQDLLAWAAREARQPAAVQLISAVPLDDLLRETIRTRQFQAWLFGSFSIASLLIVGVGVLGFSAMTSVRRRREVGIRLALGATRARIVGHFVREQVLPIGAGILLGAPAGFVVSMLVRPYIYGLEPWNIHVWALAIGALSAAAIVGTIIPARRVSRVDLSTILKAE